MDFIRKMAGGIYDYVTNYLPFQHLDTGTGNSLVVEKMPDGGLRVTTYKNYDSEHSITEDDITVVHVPRDMIERLMQRDQ